MVKNVKAPSISGVDCNIVNVEVDMSTGLPCIEMIGLLGTEVRESKDRVRVALRNNGINFPPLRITVNFSPAGIRKEGSHYDLAVAVGMLAGLGNIPSVPLDDILFAGELGLNGEIKNIPGVLPMAFEAVSQGISTFVLPKGNAKEASVVKGLKVIGVSAIEDVINYLEAPEEERDNVIAPYETDVEELFKANRNLYGNDFADLCGQEGVKRAMLVAAAGFHNILMIGTPGAGKTMAAKCLPSILPPLTMEESFDVSRIYSVCGLLTGSEGLVVRRPFIAPHHTISDVAMAGGGRIPRPGEVSKAHKGVLFLDEAVHFSHTALEILRQPMEDKEIHISRTTASYTFPADFMLVAAINPCPCGNYPDANLCSCTPEQIKKYLGKLSGPILDRIDICVETPKISIQNLNESRKTCSSSELRKRVIAACEIQKERYKDEKYTFNSQIKSSDINKYINLDTKTQKTLETIYEKMKLSVRGYHKILRVARTIADLEGEKDVLEKHIMEAVCYRSVEDRYWNI